MAILREADVPIESVSGPYGGYRVGRGLRLPPLMFTAAEAMGLVMAVLEGHRDAAEPTELVGGALAKIVRVLPERVAGPVRAVRGATPVRSTPDTWASPELTTQLIEACTLARRLRVNYRLEDGTEREMQVDPWAVVLRHSLWYLLCWSHTRKAQRVLRVDRIVTVTLLPQEFTPPADLDALRTLEGHLSQGWRYAVDVLVEAAIGETARWIPRSLGQLTAEADGGTRLRATTSNPEWYVRQLASIPAPFRVVGSPELRCAMTDLSRQLAAASGGADTQ